MNVSVLIPEMAIFSQLDEMPGVSTGKIPRVPYGPQTNVAIANRKTLYLYRLQMILKNITEDAIVEELK